MAATFATIGHSNRTLDGFLDILREARIELLADVRSFPKSRNNPVFNIDRLPEDLARIQIGYQHFPALGGRRGKQAGMDEGLNAMWRVRSFRNYADYALSEAFAAAFGELVRLGSERRTAIMCSEAVWWRCHRRIITDYLLASGYEVNHLMGAGRVNPATMTPGAQKAERGQVVYPAA